MPERYLLIRESGLREDQRLALACLQGLVNRDGPQLYVVRGPNDEHWADWYLRYGLEPEEVGWGRVGELLPAAAGAVLVDWQFRHSIGPAVTACSTQGLLPWSEALAAEHPQVPIRLDLRGRWQEKSAAYRWAAAELWPACSRDTVASVHIGAGEFSNGLLDYVVAQRAFLSGMAVNEIDFPQEAALWRGMLAQMNPLGLAVGWHQPEDIEATWVQACSEAGVLEVCSSGVGNLSFHRHVKARHPYRQDHIATARLDPAATYVTFSQTDGDSIAAMAGLQQRQWTSPFRGSAPLGWWMAPKLGLDLGPALLEYYYETKGPADYLMCGPSGAGYNYPTPFRDRKAYLALSRQLMQAADMRTVMVINRLVQRLPGNLVAHRTAAGDIPLPLGEHGGPIEELKNQYGADWVDQAVVEDYAAGLPEALGFFQGFETVVGEEDRFVGDVPWVPTKVMVDDPEQGLADIERYLAGKPKPAFVSCTVNMCGPMNRRMYEKLLQLCVQLDAKGYRVVRPDEFLTLRREARRELGR